MTSSGVYLDVSLSHELLASVAGARRPSVSVAVSRLIAEGAIESRPRSRWLLLGEPPAKLAQLHHPNRRGR